MCAFFQTARKNLGVNSVCSKLSGYGNRKNGIIEVDDPKLYTFGMGTIYYYFGGDLLFRFCVAGASRYFIPKSHPDDEG